MKLDFDPKTSVLPHFDNDFAAEINTNDISPQAAEMLRDGIEAAREGNRSEAKVLLLRVTEVEPRNEDAWIWLASIGEYPEERLVYLENVLRLNPENERALEWAKSTKSVLSDTFVRRGIIALDVSDKDFSKQNFLQAIVHDSENEEAWFRLASLADSNEEQISRLNKVLQINSTNEEARNLLTSAKKNIAEALLRKANTAAITGDKQIAERLIGEILEQSPDFEGAWVLKCHLVESLDEKLACYQNVLNINPDNEAAKSGLASLQAIMSQIDEDYVSEQQTAVESEQQVADQSEPQNVFEDVLQMERPLNDESVPKPEVDFASENTEENIRESVEPEIHNSETVDLELDSYDSDFSEEINNYQANAEFKAVQEFDAGEYLAEPEDLNEKLLEVEESEVEHDFNGHASENSEVFEMPSYYEKNEDILSPNEAAEDEYYPQYAAAEYDNEYFSDEIETDYSAEVEDSQFAENVGSENVETDLSENYENAETDFSDNDADSVEFSGEHSDKVAETDHCPFCDTEKEVQAYKCDSCEAILTLTDLEMLLGHQDANQEILGARIQTMEREKDVRGFDADELRVLAIGEINNRNLRKGLAYLRDAVKLDPNNVMLHSQVNALAIRLAEIEEQESIHNSIPRGKMILVVDDSATVRKLISSKLEKSGHEVTCAVDGVDALEKIEDISPDLILLDITMPRMDGYQVCKMIRANESTKEVPIVMISGKDGFFDKVRGRMSGTTGYITKPFGPETLMKTVETYITHTDE